MNIPDEAVEIAAADLYRRKIYSDNFSDVVGENRAFWLKEARAVLEAGAPFIAAQALRSVAWGFPASGNYRVRDVAGKLHAIADELDPQ